MLARAVAARQRDGTVYSLVALSERDGAERAAAELGTQLARDAGATRQSYDEYRATQRERSRGPG